MVGALPVKPFFPDEVASSQRRCVNEWGSRGKGPMMCASFVRSTSRKAPGSLGRTFITTTRGRFRNHRVRAMRGCGAWRLAARGVSRRARARKQRASRRVGTAAPTSVRDSAMRMQYGDHAVQFDDGVDVVGAQGARASDNAMMRECNPTPSCP